MNVERFRWVAAVVAAHPGGRVVGRTRLQKEMRLLQRLGMPSDYDFRIHYYGPYSEGLQADVNLLEQFGLVSEDVRVSQDGSLYSVFEAKHTSDLPDTNKYRTAIELLSKTDSVVLELAATYDAFREGGLEPERALSALRAKKGSKCDGGKESQALELLKVLRLQSA